MVEKKKCPFYNSVINLVLTIVIMVLGTIGIYFLNLWISVVYFVYFIVFFFIAMPLKHCQYCYYKVKETTLDKWRESYLQKHVNYAKKWGFNFFVLWFAPIILIVISFFLNFSIYALISLIGFIIVLVVMMIHIRWKVCPKCAIVDECHSAF
jgi:hypothetical protein